MPTEQYSVLGEAPDSLKLQKLSSSDFHQMDILFLVRKTNNYPPKNNRPTAASLSKSLP